MRTSLIAIRATATSVAAALLSATGCGGDSLLLPRDGEPTQLRLVSGDQQSAPAGDPVEDPLVVQALDQAGRPVPGAVIIFEFVEQPNGAELSPGNVVTDSTGTASAEVTLGTPAGDQSVEARLADSDSDLSVQFRLTALRTNGGGGEGEGDGGGGGDEGGDGGNQNGHDHGNGHDKDDR